MKNLFKKISNNKKKIGLLTAVVGAGVAGFKLANLASVLAACAKFIAESSVTASIFWVMEEPKMPTSLVLKQNEK